MDKTLKCIDAFFWWLSFFSHAELDRKVFNICLQKTIILITKNKTIYMENSERK